MNEELLVFLHNRHAGYLRDVGNAQIEFLYSNQVNNICHKLTQANTNTARNIIGSNADHDVIQKIVELVNTRTNRLLSIFS